MDDKDLPKAESAKDWYELGRESLRAGNLPGALDAFKRSLKLNHKLAVPWIGLASVLDMNGQHEEARECLRQATIVEPAHTGASLKLANAHKLLGYVEDAEREYNRALGLDPNYAPAHFGLGQLMEDMGKPDAAAAAYRSALTQDTARAEALASLLGLGRHIDVSAEIDQAKQFLENVSKREAALVGYGLGKAYEQQKAYNAAFDAYAAANVARREVAGAFDPKIFDKRVAEMISLFSQDFFEKRRGWGDQCEKPVFIVGLPRSGTTLTEQIIGSHPDCFGAGELHVLTDLATGAPDRLGKPDPPWPACAPELSKAQVAVLGREYLEQSSVRAPNGVVRIVDKQPLNFWHLGLVALALPNAKIIHCKRDIRDCGFSIFSQNFSQHQKWATDLEDIAHYWCGYRKLTDHWASVTGLQMIDVVYEETVADIESHSRRLLEFLDLPWDERVLHFHENDRAVQTPSRWQVRQPVYQSSKARWRNYEKHLGPLIAAAENMM